MPLTLLKHQENILILNNLLPKSIASNNYSSVLLKGKIEIESLKNAAKQLINQIEILNISFSNENDYFNIIENVGDKEFPFEIINTNQNFSPEYSYPFIEDEINEPFNLNSYPLFRIKLFSFSNDMTILTFICHKIIADNTSVNIIIEKLGEFYTANNTNKSLLKLTGQNYNIYQSQVLKDHQSDNYKDTLKFWIKELQFFQESVNLPTDKLSKKTQLWNGFSKKFTISSELQDKIEIFSSKHKINKEYIFLSSFAIIINRISSQDCFLLSVPVSYREKLNEKELIGCIDDYLPVKFDFEESPSFLDLVSTIISQYETVKNKPEVHSTELIKIMATTSGNYNAITQVVFNYQELRPNKFQGLSAENLYLSKKGFQHELFLNVISHHDGIDIILEYSDLFNRDTVIRLYKNFEILLSNLLETPTEPSDEIDILTADEINKIYSWNNTDREYNKNNCIHQYLENQAKLSPSQTALLWENGSMTYEELNTKANQLANFISENYNISNNRIIAISMERSPEMMIGLFAILKCGCAYLPIDPNYPAERIKLIVEDAKPILILTNNSTRITANQFKVKVIDLTNVLTAPLSKNAKNPDLNFSSDILAYIIYTSGSTGIPKGVMIKHYSVVNRISWMQTHNPINNKDVLIQKTPITFDVSVWELFWWSFTGSKLVLLPIGAEKEPVQLIEAIEKFRATIIHFVPSMFGTFRFHLKTFQEQNRINSLKTIYLSGEALSPESVNDFYSITGHGSETKLVNLYGPTEATVDVSFYDCPKSLCVNKVFIGKPIDNTKLLVINRKKKLQPIGVPGELVISGVNLAKGYLNRPELNKEKFTEISFLSDNRLPVYRTGDLAKWTINGEIDYIGRIDNQIKIRGYRIELGEIETLLCEYKGVESCAVIVNKSNPENPLLIAYLKYNGAEELNINAIKAYLLEKIPDYMVPTNFTVINEMPLTSSGKINRKALPEPNFNFQVKRTSDPGKIEDIILSIWQDVLKNNHIDIKTNFFDIGGNSIMTPLIAARLQKEFNIKVSTIDIFQYPTVEALTTYLYSQNKASTFIPEVSLKVNDRASSKKEIDNRIAVIGIAGKFPEADTKEELWGKLMEGKELISFFSDEELEKTDSMFHKNKDNPNYRRSRGVLNNIELWDAKFFGYSPNDARNTDPQQRLWFETVWNAFEDAGCDPYRYNGAISVFAGVNLNSYLFDNILRNRRIYEDYMHFGDAETFQTYVNNDAAFIATRTAYLFNLKGQAINVQSACSTSLMAIAQACSSLIAGDSDIAVAGASSVQTPQKIGYMYQTGGMRSADGHCRPFDKNCSGTVFSNAIGAVILKRLNDAIEDNDEIYGVIRGWALNNDGYDKIGFAAPSVNGQLELLRKAYSKANLNPEELSYIEAHGTATILGDPIEVAALSQYFREKTSKKKFCGLGSIKGNIGHTDEAAGVMGFIKASMSVFHRNIPPSINYTEPNPNIDFDNSPFYVTNKPVVWNNDKPMIIGVSSFGVGGTNAHVIIEEYKKAVVPTVAKINPKNVLIPVSAKSKWSLEQNIKNLIHYINQKSSEISITDIAYTTQLRRAHWQQRAFAIITENKEVEIKDFYFGSKNTKTPKIVFLFPGQGAQFINMGLEIYEIEPVFRDILDRGFAIYSNITSLDLKSIIFNPTSEELLNRTEFTQPAIFIISYGIFKLYESYGISPDASIGHSIGEYVSACISGVFDFETALKIVIKRGQLMQTVSPGSMMAVRSNLQLLEEIKGLAFEIAGNNAPQSCTISFKTDKLETVVKILKSHSIDFVVLNTSHAFHSSQFDTILNEFENYVTQFTLNIPEKSFISCITGDFANSNEVITGKYWAHQLRSTVQFNKGINTLQSTGDNIYIEAGPNSHLSGLTRQSQAVNKNTAIITSIGKELNGAKYSAFLESLGNIWMVGIVPNFSNFYKNSTPNLVKIPTYAFDKQRYWIDIDVAKLKINTEEDFSIVQEVENIQINVKNEKRGEKELNPTEKIVYQIWQISIGTDEIELNDNFFDIGGHSLLAVQTLSKIKSIFKVDMNLNDFFANPTIYDLAEFINVKLKIENNIEETECSTDLIEGEL